MPGLAEHSFGSCGSRIDEEPWRDIERKPLESPISVGSFQPILVSFTLPSYRKESPWIYFFRHRHDLAAGTKTHETILGEPTAQLIGTSIGAGRSLFLVTAAQESWKIEGQQNLLSSKDLSFFSEGASGLETIRLRGKVQPQISEEAARRLRGHEKLLQKLAFVVEEETAARGISLLKIDVLPAWSHEYEERAGVVIQVEVGATDEQRFSLWEGISERIDSLHDTLASEEKDFLTGEISVFVDQA